MSATPVNLATLNSKPSWHNLAGQVDRSACIELKASAVRRWADLQRCRTGRASSQRAIERGKPQAKTHRESAGPATISAFDVFAFMQRRKPRRLSGDYRTVKANAMRWARDEQGHGLPPSHPKQGTTTVPSGPDQGLHSNPNQGAARNKILALPGAGDWPEDLDVPQPITFDSASTPATTRRGSRAATHHNSHPTTHNPSPTKMAIKIVGKGRNGPPARKSSDMSNPL